MPLTTVKSVDGANWIVNPAALVAVGKLKTTAVGVPDGIDCVFAGFNCRVDEQTAAELVRLANEALALNPAPAPAPAETAEEMRVRQLTESAAVFAGGAS